MERPGTTSNPFHHGEIAVQSRAGARASAQRVGAGIRRDIAPPLAAFLADARVAAVGAADSDGHVWATLLVGASGFLQPASSRGHATDHEIDHLHVATHASPGDALATVLTSTAELAASIPIGLTAIDFATRRRVRVNGILANGGGRATDDGGFGIDVRQAYVNCPKYIQARTLDMITPPPITDRPSRTASAHRIDRLGDAHRALIARVDTCFVASIGPEGQADASHRGGPAGFIDLLEDARMRIPDYSGNMMFNTLGNLAVDPRIGIVIPDFARGRLLQLSGVATIDWRTEVAATYPGAERVLDITIERLVEIPDALPLGWSFREYSPFNPPAFR